jgi:hypothetical protein
MEYNTYLSDDEVDIENEVTVELDQYGMPIEEIDEEEELEIRRIVSSKILSQNSLNEEFFSGSNSGSSKKNFLKESKTPKKKTMSLNDLNNFIDKELEDKKPKKFISKRSMEKKNSDSSLSPIKSNVEIKRKFNPRCIPYLFSDEYRNRKFCDESKKPSFDNLEFPTL